MGLDVYLIHYTTPIAEVMAAKAAYKAADSALQAKHGLTNDLKTWDDKARYNAYRADLKLAAAEHGLDEDGNHPGEQNISSFRGNQIKSALYPDHYWKVGYFRSSYNPSGIDHVLHDRIGIVLSDLFNPYNEYEVAVDWADSRRKCMDALAKLRAWIDENGTYAVMEVNDYGHGPSDAKSALDMFLTEKKKRGRSPGFHHNGAGNFNFTDKPTQMRAVMMGKSRMGAQAYIVYEMDHAVMASYTQSLEIAIETCDYVLSQPDPKSYMLHWSG